MEKAHAMSNKTDGIAIEDQAHREETNKKDQKIASMEKEIERKQRIIENNRVEYTTRLNDRIHTIEENSREAQAALQRERADKVRERKAVEQTHANTVEQMEKAHRAALEKRDELHAADRAALINEHEGETKAIRVQVAEFESEAEKMEKGWKASNSRDLEKQQHTLTAERKRETLRLEGVIQDMTARHQEETQEAERKHAGEKSQWQRQLQEQNKALLSRDDEEYNLRNGSSGLPAFSSKTDMAIHDNFQEIQDLVDDLSETQWKADQTMWTTEVFEKIGGDQIQRLLRKAILQDLVWTVLFHGIFCSPFRVFGLEGEALEREWAKRCSNDDDPFVDGVYKWPAPRIEAERWRYMTIRSCNQVLRNPVPSKWDPRAKLKKDFKNSYDELVSRLKAVLGDIVEIEDSNLETIGKLVRRTAALWIDLEMHRCRIMISLTGTKSRTTTGKVSLAQKGSLALTKAPKIGRYGNAEGLDLDTFTVIDGCGGEIFKIP